MPNIYFFSGPCGCGKTTLSNAFAQHLVNNTNTNQVYIIHGDDIRGGFIYSDCSHKYSDNKLCWDEILKFNWECILNTADSVLKRGLDVIIDYVIEDELPRVKSLCNKYDAGLIYIVLTASDDAIKERISQRGDTELTERALFLKYKLDNMKENEGHLLDNTNFLQKL